MEKQCYCCMQIKPVEAFSLHKRMRDGRLNKCKECHVAYVRRMRDKKTKAELQQIRHLEYLACIKTGSRSRSRSLSEIREQHDPVNRKISALRYFHQKRANAAKPTELDDLVFEEAVRLCHMRAASTGIRWEIDHIVPVKGRHVCGLHNAHNIQVVPKSWNEKKSNVHIIEFLPRTGY
jgi:hypothetical protein